ncbi:MAG: 30S ribosomal protein S15 [Pseudopedobacter sp.]|nr:30S ribosomal protein S15 [Deinococcales bacterium]
MALNAQTVAGVVQEHAINEKDTGSTYVQVALLTARINKLSSHLNANRKDKHGQRGLQIMVGQRRRHLKYLERTDFEQYIALTDKLSIRRAQATLR